MAERSGELARRRVMAFAARWAVLAAIAVALIALAPGGEPADPPAAIVRMTEQMRYDPPRVKIHVGDTILWENASSLTHSVTADPSEAELRESTSLPEGAAPFQSGLIGPAGKWQHTFTTPGTYRYFCMPHEAFGMAGTVEVLPAEK